MRKSNTVVCMPAKYFTNEQLEEMGYIQGKRSSLLVYGKICDPDEPGALRSGWKYEYSQKSIYCKPVKCKEIRFERILSEDNYVYKYEDGEIYSKYEQPEVERWLRIKACEMECAGFRDMYRAVGVHRSLEAALRNRKIGEYLIYYKGYTNWDANYHCQIPSKDETRKLQGFMNGGRINEIIKTASEK